LKEIQVMDENLSASLFSKMTSSVSHFSHQKSHIFPQFCKFFKEC